MIFYKVGSPEPVAKIVADKLIARLLANQRIFWLVTGGSAIELEIRVSQLIKKYNLSKLTVTLTDERYGPVGHPDSNWQQLLDAGFDIPEAVTIPILQHKNRIISTEQFTEVLTENFAAADYSLGQCGIGPDGHTAGILPGSPNINTSEMAMTYADDEVTIDSPPGVKRGIDRITMTAAAIARLDEAVVCALGPLKRVPLERLEQDLPLAQQPAQALKRVPRCSIYNDYKGEVL